jgi:hypothetical protein
VKKTIFAIIASLTLALGVSTISINPAHAASHSRQLHGKLIGYIDKHGHIHFGRPMTSGTPEVCDSFLTTCLNAWGGGPLVKDFSEGVTNDGFFIFQDTGACNGGLTSPNCPITGVPSRLEIVYIQDAYTSGIVGDYQNNSGDAKAGLTPGAPWGYRMVLYGGIGGGTFQLADAHWTSNWSSVHGLGWNASGNGNQVFLNVANSKNMLYWSF